jgi:hypothetical protein
MPNGLKADVPFHWIDVSAFSSRRHRFATGATGGDARGMISPIGLRSSLNPDDKVRRATVGD